MIRPLTNWTGWSLTAVVCLYALGLWLSPPRSQFSSDGVDDRRAEHQRVDLRPRHQGVPLRP